MPIVMVRKKRTRKTIDWRIDMMVREKRLFLLRDLETREAVVFIIDQHKKKEKKAHVLDIVPGSRLLLMER